MSTAGGGEKSDGKTMLSDPGQAVTAAERARGLARETTAALVEALWSGPVGIAVLDAELRFVRVNDALAAMTELAAEAHVGRTLGDLVPSRRRTRDAAWPLAPGMSSRR